MLSEDAIEKLSERLVNRAEKLNSYLLIKLAEQINTIGNLNPTQAREILQSVKYGNDIREIAKKVSEMTNKNVSEIFEIFEEVAKKSQLFYKPFYDYRGLDFIPYTENKLLQEQVKAIAKVTAEEYDNMSRTTAFMRKDENGNKYFTDISKIYQEVTDEAITSVAQGRETYRTAMKRVMNQLADSGLRTVDYASGYSRRLDSSVRMNIMQGIRQLNIETSLEYGKQFGSDGVEIKHHKNPAPDHSSNEKDGWHDIDGQQFSNAEYERINNYLNRPVGTLNCYHMVYPIILGISKPAYTKEELEADKKANLEGFTLDGKHYTLYEGRQLQNRLELEIRRSKDKLEMFKINNDDESIREQKERLQQLIMKYKELSDVSGLPTRVERLKRKGE